jgi:hypothetical protein
LDVIGIRPNRLFSPLRMISAVRIDDRMIGGFVFELSTINHNFQFMSSGVWNTARERKKFFKLVDLCKVFIMDADPTDNLDYEEEDELDDLLELTFLYGQSISRTLGTAIDFTVGPLRVEDLDEIKAVNDFRKSIVCSCFIFLILMLSPFSRFSKGRPIDPHRTVAPATLEVSPVHWTRRLRQVSPSLQGAV